MATTKPTPRPPTKTHLEHAKGGDPREWWWPELRTQELERAWDGPSLTGVGWPDGDGGDAGAEPSPAERGLAGRDHSGLTGGPYAHLSGRELYDGAGSTACPPPPAAGKGGGR